MLQAVPGKPYTPNPVLERALDILFILHVDHEQNCSTFAMRSVGSSNTDPYLVGRRGGGGAVRPAARRRERSGPADAPRHRIARQGAGLHQEREGRRRPAHGLRPPRSTSRTTRARASSSASPTRSSRSPGKNPLLEIAQELERIALQDDYFVKRKLYPNVDFYSGLIYEAMGFPTDMFTVLFAIPRTAGWLAQWEEMLRDPETKNRAAAPDLRRRRQSATTSPSRRADVPGDAVRWRCRPAPSVGCPAHSPHPQAGQRQPASASIRRRAFEHVRAAGRHRSPAGRLGRCGPDPPLHHRAAVRLGPDGHRAGSSSRRRRSAP